jgi:hypothetical protein
MNDIIYFFSMGIYFQWEFIFVSRPELLNWAKRHARRAAFGALCPAGAFGAGRLHGKGYTPALNLQHGPKNQPRNHVKNHPFRGAPPPLQ